RKSCLAESTKGAISKVRTNNGNLLKNRGLTPTLIRTAGVSYGYLRNKTLLWRILATWKGSSGRAVRYPTATVAADSRCKVQHPAGRGCWPEESPREHS